MKRLPPPPVVPLFFVLIISLTMTATSFGQAVYGNIVGTVTDSTGAVIPGAKVTATNVQKGTSATATTTNGDGNYSIQHLIPDVYTVKIEAPNFGVEQIENIKISADFTARVDASLKPSTTETVEVTAEAPLLKTDRADVATIFDQKEVTDLPIFNRNFTQFELLTPGTQRLVSFAHAATENPQASQQIFVNGQHFSGTAYVLDGTDNQDPILGIIVINPSLDSVTETKITSQNYDAEFGRAIAGVVSTQTKSGSNTFHGSLFEFRRSDATQARDPFTQTKPDPVTNRFIPSTKWNQFGGSVGGPIFKDKLFFFGDYQGTRRTNGRSVLASFPTGLVLSTCLAASGNCNLSQYLAGGQGQVFDPTTGGPGGVGRTMFVNNQVPVARLSPIAQGILAKLPMPNSGAPNDIANNFVASGSSLYDDDAFNIRVDHHTTSKLHVFGRYSLADFRLSGAPIFGVLGGNGFGEGGLAGSANTRNQSIASGFDYSVSPTLFTDFRFGFVRYNVHTKKANSDANAASNLGLMGLNTSDPTTGGLPAFFFQKNGGAELFGYQTGDQGFGSGLGVARCNCPLTESEQQFQFVNNWSKLVENHTFKFGADLRYAENLRIPSDANRTGQLTFDAAGTSLAGQGGLSLATYLLGDVSSFGRFVTNPALLPSPGERQKRTFFYGQDTWRVTPKLTLNYGLRWEIYFPETVTKKGGGGFASLASGGYRVAGFGPFGSNGNIENSYTNFTPRIGVAYEFARKTIVRMGYGRSYDIGVFGSIFGHTVTQNLPVLAIQNLTADTDFGRVFTLAQGPPAFTAFFGLNAPPNQGGVPNTSLPANGRFFLPDGVTPRIVNFKQTLPTVDAWNVTVQHQFTETISLEAAYVGNKGTHVFCGNNPDCTGNEASLAGFPNVPFNNRRFFFNRFGWTQDVLLYGQGGDDHYNAFQLKFTKRFSSSYSILAHYTLQRASNYDRGYFAIDRSINYGPADFDRTHTFVLSQVAELPFGKGRRFLGGVSRLGDYLIGGWQFNSNTTIESGLPFNVGF